MSAGFAAAATPGIRHMPAGAAGQTVAAAVVGGTASHLGGGKFANGAWTGAFSYVFNYLSYRQAREQAKKLNRSGGEEWTPHDLGDGKYTVRPVGAAAVETALGTEYAEMTYHGTDAKDLGNALLVVGGVLTIKGGVLYYGGQLIGRQVIAWGTRVSVTGLALDPTFTGVGVTGVGEAAYYFSPGPYKAPAAVIYGTTSLGIQLYGGCNIPMDC